MPDSVRRTMGGGEARRPAGPVDELRDIILRSDRLVDRVSHVIAGALAAQVSVSGESVAQAIAPIIAQAIRVQVRESPQEIVDALYPIVGEATRKALAEAAFALPRASFRWMRRALVAAGRPFAAVTLQRVKPAIITGLILLPLLLVYGWWLSDRGALLAAAPAPLPALTAESEPPTPYPAPGPAAVDTATPVPTFSPSPVLIAGPTESLVNLDTATPTTVPPTPTRGPTPTATPTFTPYPTARPLPRVVLAEVSRTPNATAAATAIPTAVPTAWVPDSTINILLLGSDQRPDQDDWRTDVMIVVSINLDGPSAAMLSIPRDLYVWVPEWRMARINSVDTHGYAVGYPGSGPGLLKQTLLYNLGIPVHYYARVDFNGFVRIMDALDGVEVPVTCAMTDWRLKSAELDPEEEDNWELFTIDQRVHHMDGELALWYARSRQRTSDFDRSRRQQRLLRALLEKSLDADIILKVPRLWSELSDSVETDLGLGEIMQLAAVVPRLELSKIKSRFVAGTAVLGWTHPETDAAVLLPQPERIAQLVWDLLEPPAMNRAFQDPPVVEVWNGTLLPEIDLLAVDNLAWEGAVPLLGEADRQDYARTQVTFFGQTFKGANSALITKLFGRYESQISHQPDPDSPVDYRVILGYDYEPCAKKVWETRSTPTATPTPTTG